MNARGFKVTSVWLRELPSLRSNSFYLLIDNGLIQFCRQSKGSSLTLLQHQEYDSPDLADLEQFVIKLCSAKYYYGQPITVLLGGSKVYTYMRDLKQSAPGQMQDRLATLRNGKSAYASSVIDDTNNRLFLFESFDRNYVESLQKVFTKHDLSILNISTIGSHLINSEQFLATSGEALHLFNLPKRPPCFLANNCRGEIAYGEVRMNKTAKPDNQTVDSIKRAYFDEDSEVAVYHHTFNPEEPTLSTSSQTKASILTRIQRSVSHSGQTTGIKTFSSPRAKALEIASNSLRLLTAILAGLSLIGLLSLAVLTALGRGDDEQLSKYQTTYSVKLRLLNEVDRLRGEQARLLASFGSVHRSAAIVSWLCQQSYNDLWLDRISLRWVSSDSLFVNVEGHAKQESTAFLLNQRLNKRISPYSFSLSSLKPEILRNRSSSDTTVSFKLFTVIYGAD